MEIVMKSYKYAAVGLVAALGSLAAAQRPGLGGIVPGELIVKTRSGQLHPVSVSAIAGTPKLEIAADNVFSVKYKGVSLEAAIASLKANPDVVYVQPNYYVKWRLVPNDPRHGEMYGHNRVSAPAAWDVFTGSSTIVTAVLDSGARLTHEDLAPSVAPGSWNADTGTNDVTDNVGHGTHVAGTVAAATNNNKGVSSVGFRSRFFSVLVGTSLASAKGIRYAADNGARIVNMSYGVPFLQAEADACTYAWGKGVLLVSAAGNENTDNETIIGFPALHKEVINVGSSDQQDRKSGFSNFGKTVTIAAPGSDILSTINTGDSAYALLSGTSMASPNVCSVAALVWGRNPSLTNLQIKNILHNTADFIGPWVVRGRVNAQKALALAAPFVAYDSTVLSAGVGVASGSSEGSLLSPIGSSELLASAVARVDTSLMRVQSVNFGRSGNIASVDTLVKVNASRSLIRSANVTIVATAPTPVTTIVFAYNFVKGTWEQAGTSGMSGGEKSFTVSVPVASLPNYVNSSGHMRVYVRAVQPARIRNGQFVLTVNRVGVDGLFDPTATP
jgi:thermitase